MVDDMPVGGGGGKNPFGAESEQPPAQAAGNADDDKPLEERLVSKAWAVRKTAFEELLGTIGKFEAGTNNSVMNEHASKWAKYLAEPNPGALEKVLDCFHAYIDKCDPALLASVQNSIYAPMLDKGLGAAKPSLKTKSMDCMLLYFEVSENFGEETLDALQAQIKSSKPKIALTAIQLLAALMLAYGIKKFNPAKFGPQIVAAANSSAPANRTEAMNCYKAIFQWVGEAGVQPFIDPLKEAQKVALKKDFEAIKAEKKQFKRKTRTEQEIARQNAVDDAVNAAMEEEKKEEVIDVYDISAPQDILGQFGPDWASATLALKKWNEKSEAMQAVITAADVPKLAPGDYTGLFEVVKKLAGDSHVTVCQHAIRAIGCLAKGLRGAFHDMALQAVPACFAKFKEKRLTEDILTALDRMITNCIQLGEIVENLKAVKTEKTPLTKLNIAVFIEKALRVTYIDDLEDIVDAIGPLAVSVSDEKDAALRDQGLIVLGVLLARVPATTQKYVDPLIEAKKTKINAAKESVKISKYDKSEKKAAAAAAAAKKKAAAAAKAAPKSTPAKKAAAAMDDSAADDNVLSEVAPAKPRAPPSKKGPPKQAAAGADEIEQPGPPKRGPPARLAAKAGGAAAASGPAKTVKAEDIQEEDLGSGLGKEQAIEKVQGFYDAAHVAKFEEAKWQDKKEGFEGLKEQIEQLKPDTTMVEATAKFIKAKMKDWKESNLVMMKEAIQVLLLMTQHCDNVPKRAVAVYAPFLCEKIGDIKLNGPIKEALLNASEHCSAKFTSIQIVKKGLATKAPNNVKESCNFLASLIEEFGAGRVAIKECIDFAVNSANNANKQVRDAAMAMLTVLYKHLGEKTTQFLDGVKPATMQLIEKEFEKITPYAKGEYTSQRQVRGEAAAAPGGGGGGGGAAAEEPDALAELENAMPRADISKQLNAKLIKQFTEADWKLKVKGCEAVHAILREAQMRIQPDGIGDLMEQLKVNQKASNKAVLKQVILLMGTMAEACGQPIFKYNKKCFLPLLSFLGDKAALMRQDVVATANKWSEAIGAEHVINNMCTYLTDGNPEMRNECLKWICENKAAIAKCEHQPMIKPLIMCLTDRSGPIRTMADEAIVTTMGFVGFAVFNDGIKDLKPAVQGTVRPLLEKAKQKAISANPDAEMDETEEEVKPAATAASKKAGIRGGAATGAKGASAARSNVSARGGKGAEEEKKASPTKAPAAKKTAVASSKPTLKSAVQQPAEEEAFAINPGNKERRAAADSKSKWAPDEFKPAHIAAVKKHSEEIFGAEVSTLMWTNDFKKHVKVIDKLLSLIDSSPEDLMECVDIIFKWTTIKLAESNNTAFQNCVYDFFQKLFEFLIRQQYLFWEHEAEVVIPLFCDKVGNNNATLRQKVKQLIKQCFEMHDSKKTLLHLIKHGAMSKNLKSAGEALDEIAIHLRQIQSVPFGEQQIKVIAKLVDSKDSAVRENSICVLSEIYKQVDEDIWRVMGTVPLKVKGLLETRFKKVKGGLGASSNNLNVSAARSNKKTSQIGSPRGSGTTTKPNVSIGQDALTKSFNPGLKTQTPRVGLKFNPSGTQPAQVSSDQQQQQPQQQLTRSFRPGTSSQSNLARSFGARDGVRGFGANRPQTATAQNEEAMNRSTMPPPTSGDTHMKFGASSMRHTEKLNFYPQQQQLNNEMHFADDDEDLREHLQAIEGSGSQQQQKPKAREPLDPETQRQVDDIMKYISNLKYSSDLNKRVESLIALNEIIQAIQTHEKSIQHTANDLISAFTHVLIDIFERPRQDTPLRFAKYFVTIVNKTCQCPTIMSVVREQELYELGEQLLTRLLIDNLDKLGDEKEGEFILKNLNGSMLRCLENCNKTSIFCVLFNLLRRYKDNPAQVKLPGLIIKCLLKLSKILEKVISELEIERVLLVIHLYLISIDHEAKTSNDEMGIRIVKTLVHEMVKIKQHSILESYRVVENHEVEDKHLHRWIRIILNTLDPNASSDASRVNASVDSSTVSQSTVDREIGQIMNELKSTDTFQQAIPKLASFLARNPHLSLDYYMRDLSQHFQKMIKENLENYRNSHSDSGSTPNATSQANINPQDQPSSINKQGSEHKRFGFSNRGSAAPGGEGGGSGFTAAAAGGSSAARLSQPQPRQPEPTTSTDRINQYQSKLSSMREKFQQRKTLAPAAEVGQGSRNSISASSNSMTPNQTQGKASNMNASFSAMNSSLQQRWKAAQNKQGTARESTGAAQAAPAQFSNTMVAGSAATLNRFSSEVAQPNTANALSTSNTNRASGGSAEAGASNQDLTKRLAELKGKLAALKKN